MLKRITHKEIEDRIKEKAELTQSQIDWLEKRLASDLTPLELAYLNDHGLIEVDRRRRTLEELANLPPRQKQVANQIKYEHELGPRVKQVIEYVFAHPMASRKQVAEAMGLSYSRVTAILHHDKVLRSFPRFARRKITNLIPQAIKRFEDLLDQNENLEVARKVSESVLNSEKVLENQPAIQINVLQSMTNDDLERKIGVSRTLPGQSLDGELA